MPCPCCNLVTTCACSDGQTFLPSTLTLEVVSATPNSGCYALSTFVGTHSLVFRNVTNDGRAGYSSSDSALAQYDNISRRLTTGVATTAEVFLSCGTGKLRQYSINTISRTNLVFPFPGRTRRSFATELTEQNTFYDFCQNTSGTLSDSFTTSYEGFSGASSNECGGSFVVRVAYNPLP